MRARETLGALGIGAFAVVCCAGLPAVLALVGGVTVVGLLGGGLVAAVALVACVAMLVVRARRRRDCVAPPSDRRVGG